MRDEKIGLFLSEAGELRMVAADGSITVKLHVAELRSLAAVLIETADALDAARPAGTSDAPIAGALH